MDTGFHHDQTLSSALNRHTISFQPSAINSTSEMIMMGDYYRMNSSSGMVFSGNSSMINSYNSGFSQIGNSCRSVLLDSIQGLKHDAGLAVEWSIDEQYKLEEGLSKYANEPNILRYIKIAATLHDKTVRDVALRCRWMTRKRRKKDELKLKDNKDKLVELSSKPSISSPRFSVTMNNRVQTDGTAFEAIRHILEQNKRVLGQISTNISALKLQENVDLFSHTKNTITAILNDMRYMPGPPLPISLNEDLANTILPTINQKMMLGSSSIMHLKQETDY